MLGPTEASVSGAQQPPPPAGAAAASPAGDPPARVGRLTALVGTVSFHTADQTQWSPATANYPVTDGTAIWTEPQASVAVEVGATHIALSERTEFDVGTLDAQKLEATEPQGEIYVRIPFVAAGETYSIATPRGTVTIAGTGRFEIAAGDTDSPTTVTVVDGAAQISGPNINLTVNAHQMATITGTDTFQGSVGPEADDQFLTAQLRLEQPPPQATATASATATATTYSAPPAVQAMTGSEACVTQGSWTSTPDYGQVWYPPVQQGWVPYRDGHWAYVAPWGWTWVDNASWGFAPFHYGRWVYASDRWGWAPIASGDPYGSAYVAPAYAPALVSWVGLGAAAAVGFAAGLALSGGFGGNVGWVPLGYREPYFPPYYVSRPYLENINRSYVPRATLTDIGNSYTRIYNNNSVHNTVINNFYGARPGNPAFANIHGATFAPASAIVRSEPIGPHVVRVSAQQLAEARPMAEPPVRPTAQTFGASHAVLERVNPAAARVAPAEPARTSPGPAVRQPLAPGAAGPASRPVLLPHAGAPGRAATTAARAEPGPRPAGQAPVAPRVGAPPIRSGNTAGGGLPHLAPHGGIAEPPPVRGGAPGPAIAPRPGETARPAAPQAAAHPAAPGRPASQPAVAPHAAPPVPSRPAEAARPALPAHAEPVRPEPRVTHPVAEPRAVPRAIPAAPHAAPQRAEVPHAAPAAPRPAVAPHVAPAPRVEPRPAPVERPVAPRPAPRPEPAHRVCPPGHTC